VSGGGILACGHLACYPDNFLTSPSTTATPRTTTKRATNHRLIIIKPMGRALSLFLLFELKEPHNGQSLQRMRLVMHMALPAPKNGIEQLPLEIDHPKQGEITRYPSKHR